MKGGKVVLGKDGEMSTLGSGGTDELACFGEIVRRVERL